MRLGCCEFEERSCEIQQGVGLGAAWKCGADGHGFVAVSNQTTKEDASAAWEATLVDPVVVAGHVGVNERACGVEFFGGVPACEQFVHGPLALAWGRSGRAA